MAIFQVTLLPGELILISILLGDEVKFLKKKYKKSQNKIYHDFFKTKVCPLNSLVKDSSFARL